MWQKCDQWVKVTVGKFFIWEEIKAEKGRYNGSKKEGQETQKDKM